MLDLPTRLRYWRSLLQYPTTDHRLVPGHVAELRSALRDAIEELEKKHSNHSLRWRDNWIGTVQADRPAQSVQKVHQSKR